MGDRTSVTLTVLTSQAVATESLFADTDFENKEEHENFTSFYFYEINYGELDFLSALQQAGIPFDSDWYKGDEYDSGCESCRFTANGGIESKELYDSDRNPPINYLLQYIEQPEQLRAFILDYKANITVLPWDNQEEYGKLYRTAQLLQLNNT